MMSFYALPKEHWTHLRTTNVVESARRQLLFPVDDN